MTRTRMAVVLGLLLAVAGCSVPAVETPEGFARLAARGEYRAVSPEGMLFRVRTLDNKPEKPLEFWSQALAGHLENEGYRPAGSPRSFSAAGAPGLAFEWALPYGHDSYLYLTALAVRGRRIILVEAAAPFSVFVLHREALYRSLDTVGR